MSRLEKVENIVL